MALSKEVRQQLIDLFQQELEEQCAIISEGLLTLESLINKENCSGDEFKHIVNSVFRAAHNIKGAAQGVGLKNIAHLSHQLESVFSSVRQGDSLLTNKLITQCFELLDAMPKALDDIEEDTKSTQHDASTPRSHQHKVNENDLASNIQRKDATSTYSTIDTVENLEPIIPETPPESSPLAERVTQRMNRQKTDSFRVEADKIFKINAHVEELQISRITLDELYPKLQSASHRLGEVIKAWDDAIQSPNSDSHLKSTNEEKGISCNLMDTIREIYQELECLETNARNSRNQVRHISTNLAEHMLDMRLVPLEQRLQPFRRIVRDLAESLGKAAELHISVEGIEIDRIIIDALNDPLLHIFRNAVDHGIENKQKRLDLGKPSTGKINVNASAHGGNIYFEIQDDGAGFDIESIKKKALKHKIVSPIDLQSMTNMDILNLIFLPAFSTNDIVTNISGRGMGMDIVKASVTALRGDIQLCHPQSGGACIKLRVPFSVATEHGVLVRADTHVFVIPTFSVHSVIEVSPSEIYDVECNQVVAVNDEPIPLRLLLDLLSDHSVAPKLEQFPIVIVEDTHRKLGLVVDEILGEREIVVKPFQRPILTVNNIKGGTQISDGTIIMVLDSHSLINTALSQSSNIKINDSSTEATLRATEILIVDDSITTRTLEKNILESNGYEVTTAVDGKEAWEKIQHQHFDLVITDIEMPQMDGFELTEHIKSTDTYADMPVVVVTSLEKPEDKQRGLEVGANAYIVKGDFETQVLIDAIAHFVPKMIAIDLH